MPTINGRLTCCSCGKDLGSADDPYRDPSCDCDMTREAYEDPSTAEIVLDESYRKHYAPCRPQADTLELAERYHRLILYMGNDYKATRIRTTSEKCVVAGYVIGLRKRLASEEPDSD